MVHASRLPTLLLVLVCAGAALFEEDATLIPRVDLQKPYGEIIDALRLAAASGGPGFFYLLNHGIEEAVFENAVREAHRFHSLPKRAKLEISAVGYGGGRTTTKGYVPPLSEGWYGKDASDVRPAEEKVSSQSNLREALVFRYPEHSEIEHERYLSNYTEFLQGLDPVVVTDSDPSSRDSNSSVTSDAEDARHRISHPSNRVALTENVADGARRFFLANQWPNASYVPEFRAAVETYFSEMRKLAQTVFKLCLQAIPDDGTAGLSDVVTNDKGMMTFNLVHYPPFNGTDDETFGIVDHTDWEMFTLLYPTYLTQKHIESCQSQDEDDIVAYTASSENDGNQTTVFTGLEVWYQGRWVAVPRIPGAIIVNQGEMLTRLSGGRFRTPVHRVQAQSAFHRYSLVSFWAPNYDVALPDPVFPCGKVLTGEHYLLRNGFV